MGLDWCLKLKPKNGYESELQQRLKRLNKDISDEESEQLIKRRDEISICPCQAVNAPKVKDREGWQEEIIKEFNKNQKEAKKLLKEHPNHSWAKQWSAKKLEDYLKEQSELFDCANCQAKALITGIAVRSCEFRGKVITYMDGLPSELKQRAYIDMNAEEMLQYATELEYYLDKVSSEDKEYLQGAIDFLRRWGNLGFSIWAWY